MERNLLMLRSSYTFRSEEQASILLFDSIGWEQAEAPVYSFNGQTRPETNNVIFQYTLSGEGRIEIDGMVHRLTRGSAFLVTIPSMHKYYYPEAGTEPWEFIWLNVRGPLAIPLWDQLIAHSGPVIQLPQESVPIDLLWSIFKDVQVHEERDLHVITAKVFQWILSMEKHLKKPNLLSTSIKNEKLLTAIQFMKDNLPDNNLSLDDVAAHLEVSKHHLCRLFQKNIHLSPFEFLRRRRIESAASKLKTTDLPISQIATETGFDNASYFGKVFRSYFGVSPLAYRQQDLEFLAKHVFFEN
ncbi:AraC family transcriptional regulator [Paenibacillus sp. FA6]|uniref:helix-turn-helix transcriptional regulator n=1 Tax=Paenibacillus sp. FA6 TaxID=3413029 RepID=UPI003F65B727